MLCRKSDAQPNGSNCVRRASDRVRLVSPEVLCALHGPLGLPAAFPRLRQRTTEAAAAEGSGDGTRPGITPSRQLVSNDDNGRSVERRPPVFLRPASRQPRLTFAEKDVRRTSASGAAAALPPVPAASLSARSFPPVGFPRTPACVWPRGHQRGAPRAQATVSTASGAARAAAAAALAASSLPTTAAAAER